MWNYQLIKKQIDEETWEYRICEVYHFEDEPKPSYTWPDDTLKVFLCPHGCQDEDEVLEDLRWTLTHMLKDLDRPILRIDEGEQLSED